MEIDQEIREVIDVYFIGAVILFTLSVGGTFFLSLFQKQVDLLVPLKALTLYSIFSLLLLNYIIDSFFEGVKRVLYLGTALALELGMLMVFIPHLGSFFGQSQFYSFGQYPLMFKVLPAVGLLFAISGVFVVVYYSVDLKLPASSG